MGRTRRQGRPPGVQRRRPSRNPSSINASNIEGQSKICMWCYTAVDSLSIDRRVVSVAISHYNRYTSLSDTSFASSLRLRRNEDDGFLVIACMTLALKLHANRNDACHGMDNDSYLDLVLYTLQISCQLSRRSVAKMKLKVCESLCWYLNPLVPINYLEEASPLLDEVAADKDRISRKLRHEIIDVSQYLMEVCVYDARVCLEHPSSVAHAVILVAMEDCERVASFEF